MRRKWSVRVGIAQRSLCMALVCSAGILLANETDSGGPATQSVTCTNSSNDFVGCITVDTNKPAAPIAAAPPSVARPAAPPRAEPTLAAGVTRLPTDVMGPFANLPDGSVLAIDGEATIVSTDDGVTWSQPRPIFPADTRRSIRPERALLRTAAGTLILVFIDNLDRKWQWKPDDLQTMRENRLNVWATRSSDNGRTWTDLQLIQPGYCGAIRDIIETSRGRVIVTSQKLLPEKARHATVTYASDDEGKTWQASNVLDVDDEPGDHAGGFEATVFEQRDHRLRLLIRTNKQKFWHAFSDDGLRWTQLGPADIEAAHAPGLVKRLQSGRLVLVWNKIVGNRKQLFLALSDDDGKTWQRPTEIAAARGWLSYPYLLERRPGELWITTMQGGLRARLNESDFVPSARDAEKSK